MARKNLKGAGTTIVIRKEGSGGSEPLTSAAIITALGYTPAAAGGASGPIAISDVTGLQSALDSKQPSGSYANATHTHVIADVTGLQSVLDSKAASSHSHVIADITGLQSALDSKQAAGSYAAASHTHAIADVTGLQTALNGKQPSGSYLTSTDLTWTNVTGKPTTFPPSTHTHVIADVTGLQTALDGKATLNGNVSFRDVTATRGDGTGVIYFGNGSRYLYFDGTNYTMPVSGLVVGGPVLGSNLSGTNTGDQFTGVAASSLIGRTSASAGPAEVITLGSNLSMSGTTLNAASGTDPWTTITLASDYNNATVTSGNITDGVRTFVFVPTANQTWELEARILIWTTSATNLPRVGFFVDPGAASGYGAVNIWQAGATANTSVSAFLGWNNPAAAQLSQIPAGGVLAANTPYLCEVIASGKAGATPAAMAIQMACETAAAATCYVKAGSFMKTRKGF